MSMILGLQAISDDNAGRILLDPPLVWRLLAPDDPEVYYAERTVQQGLRQAERSPGLLARLFGRGAPPPAPEPAAEAELPELPMASGEHHLWDLDKAWHAIHWMLTGTKWEGDPPLNLLVQGGLDVGTIAVGYGPVRVMKSGEVGEAHTALTAITDEELRSRFDGEAMQSEKIYPESIWTRDPTEDDVLGYVMESVDTLRAALAHCTEHDLGLLITVQ